MEGVVEEGDVVAQLFGLAVYAFQHHGEKLVGHVVAVEDAKVAAAVRLERARRGVGIVADLPRHPANHLRLLCPDAGTAVQRFGYGGNG